MKYFSKEWCFSELEDREIQKRVDFYQKYIERIFNELPYVLKILLKINLHDGIVKQVTFSKHSNNIKIIGLFGDLQVGYFALTLNYKGLINSNIENLITIFKEKKLNILSDELERKNKYFSHKFLFTNQNEIDLNFKDLELQINNISSEDFKSGICNLIINE